MNIDTERYTFIELDGEENWCIKIGSGAYKHVVFKYHSVRADPSVTDRDGNCILKFNYEVLMTADLPETAFAGNSNFENMIGDILYDIIVNGEPVAKKGK